MSYTSIAAPTETAASEFVDRLAAKGLADDGRVRTFVSNTTYPYFDREAHRWAGGDPITVVAVAHGNGSRAGVVAVAESCGCTEQDSPEERAAAEAAFADSEALSYAEVVEPVCNTFWGSHGCDRPKGHDLPHICGSVDTEDGPCSVHDGVGVRHFILDGLSIRQPMPTFL